MRIYQGWNKQEELEMKEGKEGRQGSRKGLFHGLCNTAHLFTPCSLHMCANVYPNTAHTRSSLVSKRAAETVVNKSD